MVFKKAQGRTRALLVFADIVDSSRYSAILSYEDYADRLYYFQSVFEHLGRRYFPVIADDTTRVVGYRQVAARGDEGVVFVVDQEKTPAGLIFKAVEFLYHLKGVLRFQDEGQESGAPTRIGIGAGIHFERVAYRIDQVGTRPEMAGIEGYAINFAKRVESCSRDGRYSKVFLSAEAAKHLEFEPLVLAKARQPLQGIARAADLYEVQSGLLGQLMLSADDPLDQRMIDGLLAKASRPNDIDEPWIKALAVSVLDCLLSGSQIPQRRREYRALQSGLAWQSPSEDDPVLLYVRALECGEKRRHTQQLRYLKQLIEDHPNFIHLRPLLIKACWAIARSKAERAEKVYARDLAEELVERWSHVLSAGDKAEFREVLGEMGRERDRKARKPSRKRK